MPTKVTDQDVTVYAQGLMMASVCTSLDTHGMLAKMNTLHHPGTSHGWQVADEPFRTGEPNPCVCHDDADRRHYLLEC